MLGGSRGWTVLVSELSSGWAEDLKNLIKSKYNQSGGLKGCVVIGDLGYCWFEIGSDSFPCELFMMDMDGSRSDSDNDGKYDTHTNGSGDQGPEVYIGRIVARDLTLESGQNRVSLTKRYLNRVHSYRQGSLTSSEWACLYTDDDWSGWHQGYYDNAGWAWKNCAEYYNKWDTCVRLVPGMPHTWQRDGLQTVQSTFRTRVCFCRGSQLVTTSRLLKNP